MTCIVGFVDTEKNNVYIGADSAGVAGYDIDVRKDEKVFRNGDFIMGCTSSFRMIQLLRFSFKPPALNTPDVYRYMCTTFIDEIRKCFKEGGYLQKYETGDEKGGTFLVGYKNRLFQIENDFQVGENLNGLDSCGCGCYYAKGALYILSKLNMSPEEKVLEALKAAEYHSGGVCGPFHVLKT